jgi:SsrA-binding protein
MVITNKRAYFDYEILETIEAGIVLSGQEVKSVKLGQVSLKGSYVTVKDGEVWLINAHISPYKMAGPLPDYDPVHPRKLLLHKKQIDSLIGKSKIKGLTLLPLKVYTKKGKIKILIGLGKGKKKYDKRAVIREREEKRKIQKVLKDKFLNPKQI